MRMNFSILVDYSWILQVNLQMDDIKTVWSFKRDGWKKFEISKRHRTVHCPSNVYKSAERSVLRFFFSILNFILNLEIII